MEYAVTGVTGTVGGEVARNLLAAGEVVRAVLRDANKTAILVALRSALLAARSSRVVCLSTIGAEDGLFRAQGTKNPTPRVRMLDGFNEGLIELESGVTGSVKGTTTLESVLRTLIASGPP